MLAAAIGKVGFAVGVLCFLVLTIRCVRVCTVRRACVHVCVLLRRARRLGRLHCRRRAGACMCVPCCPRISPTGSHLRAISLSHRINQ